MTGRITRVRVDRVVLRGVDMGMHDAGTLPARIASELERHPQADNSLPPGDAALALATTADRIAADVASRIAAEVRGRADAP